MREGGMILIILLPKNQVQSVTNVKHKRAPTSSRQPMKDSGCSQIWRGWAKTTHHFYVSGGAFNASCTRFGAFQAAGDGPSAVHACARPDRPKITYSASRTGTSKPPGSPPRSFRYRSDSCVRLKCYKIVAWVVCSLQPRRISPNGILKLVGSKSDAAAEQAPPQPKLQRYQTTVLALCL